MNNPIFRKTLLLTFCLLPSAFLLQAQAPQGIPYQAIARNASGVAIANTAVKVRFSIRDSIATGAIKYQETHSPTTSALGLFSVNVGMGTVVSGTFSGINWGKNAKFLQVELNTTGGTTYTDLGTTQMMSVPYALQSNGIKMRASFSGDTLFTGNGNFLIIPGLTAANPILNEPSLPVTDIDGNVYQTVLIGNQVWMKENLKVSKYRNGNSIPSGLTDSQWNNTTSGAYSVFNNNQSNNSIYGKLYNWFAVTDSRGLCPNGWHVPSDGEWTILENYLGGRSIAGGKMKSISNLWLSPNNGATNISGFSGLPGSLRGEFGFDQIEISGNWWTSTEFLTYYTGAMYRTLITNGPHIASSGNLKIFGVSVRCLKD